MIVIHHGLGVERGLGDLLEGRTLVRPPYKDLKAEEIRDLVEAYSQTWPHRNATLLAGPLDEANPSTLDILLKRIEEPYVGAPDLILWAHDYGSVPETIRSRCGEKYHFAPPSRHRLYDEGERLFEALLKDDLVGVCGVVGSLTKEDYRGILEALLEVSVKRGELRFYTEELKRLLRRPQITQVSLYGHFLGLDPY